MKGKYKTIILTFALLILSCLLFIVISKRKSTDTQAQELKFLHFNVEVESKDLVDWTEAKRFHLINGWFARSKPPEANDEESIIRFFCFDLKDRSLFLELENLFFSGAEPRLLIDVLLNGEFLKSIELYTMDIFQVLCPGKMLKKGENRITLRLNNRKTDKNRKKFNERIRYFTLRKIYFKDIDYSAKAFLNLQKDKDMLHQPANSIFRIAVDTDESKQLNFTVRPLRLQNRENKLVLRKVENNPHPIELMEVSLNTSVREKRSLEFNERGERQILEFDFSSSDKENFLVWEKIELLNEKVKTSVESVLKPLEKKPHVFLIIIDAARFDIIGKKIEGRSVTPNIEEFSNYSYNFSDFYANAPYTGPSVASILSGYLPEVHTVRLAEYQLPEELKVMPEYFHESGYKTHIVVGNFILFRGGLVKRFQKVSPVRPFGSGWKVEGSSYNNVEKAVDIINKLNLNVPNFVYFHFLPPHAPYNPPNTRYKVFSTKDMNESPESLYKSYLNNYFYADFLVGQVLKSIKERGLFDDSLIIVASDHGEAFGEHDFYGHIETNYREMIQVPFLFKFPGQKNRVIIENLYSFIDLLPTFAVLFDFPYDNRWQGKPISFDQVQSIPRRYLYSRAGGRDFNISVFDENLKYIFYSGKDELYDLKYDPSEFKDISGKNQFLTLYLKQKLFYELFGSLELKKALKVKEIQKKVDKEFMIRELKSLGYL